MSLYTPGKRIPLPKSVKRVNYYLNSPDFAEAGSWGLDSEKTEQKILRIMFDKYFVGRIVGTQCILKDGQGFCDNEFVIHGSARFLSIASLICKKCRAKAHYEVLCDRGGEIYVGIV